MITIIIVDRSCYRGLGARHFYLARNHQKDLRIHESGETHLLRGVSAPFCGDFAALNIIAKRDPDGSSFLGRFIFGERHHHICGGYRQIDRLYGALRRNADACDPAFGTCCGFVWIINFLALLKWSRINSNHNIIRTDCSVVICGNSENISPRDEI